MASLNPIKYLRFIARVHRYSRKVKDRTSLSFTQQLAEVYRLLKLNQLEPKEYYETYELFANDLTWEDKTRFLSRNQFAKMDERLNPRKSYGLLNKLVFHVYAERFDLPMPRMYGLFDPRHGWTAEGEPLSTVEDLEKFLARPELDQFLFKPISTDQARGIIVCGIENGNLIELGKGEITAADLHQRLSGTHHSKCAHVEDSYIIEERVKQHPWYDRYGKDFVHHFRIVTFLASDGEVEYVGGTMGIGLSGHYIHVAGVRGVSSGIDENYCLKPAVRAVDSGMEYLHNHPETGALIAGEKLPGFEESLALALKAQKYIPHMRCLGWDVVPTERGPVILEGNPFWNWEKFQRSNRRGLIRGKLAAELPKILK